MLKEIGREEQFRNMVARVIVGLESEDRHVINDYIDLLDDLYPDLRQMLIGAIISMQHQMKRHVKKVCKK